MGLKLPQAVEPTGAFPRCRSRLGVFDQHGNVAEAMTRYDPAKEKTYSQLKGISSRDPVLTVGADASCSRRTFQSALAS